MFAYHLRLIPNHEGSVRHYALNHKFTDEMMSDLLNLDKEEISKINQINDRILQQKAAAKLKKDMQHGISIDAHGKRELNGPSGPEPVRYGDWEHNGRCIDCK